MGESWFMISWPWVQRLQQDLQPSHPCLASPLPSFIFSLVFHSLNTLFLLADSFCDFRILLCCCCLRVGSVVCPRYSKGLTYWSLYCVSLWDWIFKKAVEWRNTCVSLERGPIFWLQIVSWEVWVRLRCSGCTWWHFLCRRSLNTRLCFLEQTEIRICPYLKMHQFACARPHFLLTPLSLSKYWKAAQAGVEGLPRGACGTEVGG